MPPSFSRSRTTFLLLALLAPACLGDADDPPSLGASVQEVINERNATVATGHQHSCAIAADTTVQCWGRNTYGQLGNGTTASSSLPVTVTGVVNAVAVTAGKYHSCAALANGTARCWGQGSSGQLGNGSTLDRTTPVTVSGLGSVTSLSAGGAHTCATQASGHARCWGSNTYGQLGTSTTTSASLPQQVMYRATPTSSLVALTGTSEIETGTWSTCARMSSGAVVCWGRNNYGQLGDGTTTQRNLPTAASGITTAVDVAVGDQHACAVVSNGRARCWGQNLFGQLGDGTQSMRTTPVEVKRQLTPMLIYPLVNITAASAGQYHSCLRSAGEVWCMGRNDDGQLGMDITPYAELLARRTVPVVAATELAAGGDHTCVRRPSGGVMCFGDDAYGQVGSFARCPVVPTAVIVEVETPGGTPLKRGPDADPIYYTDRDELVLTVETTACAQVSRVDFRNLTIDETDPIETQDGDITYDVVSTTDRDDGTRQIVVHIGFNNLENGTSAPVIVELTSPAGNAVTAGLTLAEVLAADPGHNGYIDLGTDELMNEILQSMYAKFGDSNYWSRTASSPIVIDPINFYDFNYPALSVVATTEGVTFSATAKADLSPWANEEACNPTVTTHGTFRVVLVDGVVTTEWVDPLDASVSWPLACSILTGYLLDFVTMFVAEVKDGKVTAKINERVAEFNDYCDTNLTNTCVDLIQSITHHPGFIRVTLNRHFDSVTYRQPYISSQFAPPPVDAPLLRGLAIPSEPFIVIGGGMAQGCGTQSCTSLHPYVGPSGLFNWDWAPRTMLPVAGEPWGAHPPILDPWVCDPVYGCAHITGRQGPWLRQRGMRRTLGGMPMPDRNVGALVSRVFRADGTVSPMYFNGDLICSIPDPAPGSDIARLVVGRNDHTAGGTAPLQGEHGQGDALVTVVFSGADIDRDCATE